MALSISHRKDILPVQVLLNNNNNRSVKSDNNNNNNKLIHRIIFLELSSFLWLKWPLIGAIGRIIIKKVIHVSQT